MLLLLEGCLLAAISLVLAGSSADSRIRLADITLWSLKRGLNIAIYRHERGKLERYCGNDRKLNVLREKMVTKQTML